MSFTIRSIRFVGLGPTCRKYLIFGERSIGEDNLWRGYQRGYQRAPDPKRGHCVGLIPETVNRFFHVHQHRRTIPTAAVKGVRIVHLKVSTLKDKWSWQCRAANISFVSSRKWCKCDMLWLIWLSCLLTVTTTFKWQVLVDRTQSLAWGREGDWTYGDDTLSFFGFAFCSGARIQNLCFECQIVEGHAIPWNLSSQIFFGGVRKLKWIGIY